MKIRTERVWSDPGSATTTSAYLLTLPHGHQAIARRDITSYGPEWKLFQIEKSGYGGFQIEWVDTTDSLWNTKEMFVQYVSQGQMQKQPGVPHFSKKRAIEQGLW